VTTRSCGVADAESLFALLLHAAREENRSQ
jgi:hypothetical protein